jgi:hypothetical protein
MSENAKQTDFAKLFEYATLPKIHGEPDYDQLKVLKDKLKANATKIPSDLGGGAFGHLGLVLSPAEYANVSAVPYVRPLHPGVLVIPNASSERTETRLRNEHKRLLSLCHETITVENALKKQISETVEDLYLEELRDDVTNTILQPIHVILTHLLTNFGEIESDALTEKELQLRKMEFSTSDPLTKVYKAVEDLEQLSIAANSRYSAAQLISMALSVIKNTNDYHRPLEDWYARALIEQTWPNLKTHFLTARKYMRKARGATMRDGGLHAVNHISEEIREVKSDLQSVQASDLEALAENQSAFSHVINNMGSNFNTDGRLNFVPHEYIQDENIPQLQPSTNSTMTTDSQLTQLVKTLTQEVASIKATMLQTQPPFQPSYPQNYQATPYTSNGGGRGRSGRGGRGGRSGRGRGGRGQGRGAGRAPQKRTNISQYCWSHGACSHPSWFCERPKEGHQYNATFENKMDGSTFYCPP